MQPQPMRRKPPPLNTPVGGGYSPTNKMQYFPNQNQNQNLQINYTYAKQKSNIPMGSTRTQSILFDGHSNRYNTRMNNPIPQNHGIQINDNINVSSPRYSSSINPPQRYPPPQTPQQQQPYIHHAIRQHSSSHLATPSLNAMPTNISPAMKPSGISIYNQPSPHQAPIINPNKSASSYYPQSSHPTYNVNSSATVIGYLTPSSTSSSSSSSTSFQHRQYSHSVPQPQSQQYTSDGKVIPPQPPTPRRQIAQPLPSQKYMNESYVAPSPPPRRQINQQPSMEHMNKSQQLPQQPPPPQHLPHRQLPQPPINMNSSYSSTISSEMKNNSASSISNVEAQPLPPPRNLQKEYTIASVPTPLLSVSSTTTKSHHMHNLSESAVPLNNEFERKSDQTNTVVERLSYDERNNYPRKQSYSSSIYNDYAGGENGLSNINEKYNENYALPQLQINETPSNSGMGGSIGVPNIILNEDQQEYQDKEENINNNNNNIENKRNGQNENSIENNSNNNKNIGINEIEINKNINSFENSSSSSVSQLESEVTKINSRNSSSSNSINLNINSSSSSINNKNIKGEEGVVEEKENNGIAKESLTLTLTENEDNNNLLQLFTSDIKEMFDKMDENIEKLKQLPDLTLTNIGKEQADENKNSTENQITTQSGVHGIQGVSGSGGGGEREKENSIFEKKSPRITPDNMDTLDSKSITTASINNMIMSSSSSINMKNNDDTQSFMSNYTAKDSPSITEYAYFKVNKTMNEDEISLRSNGSELKYSVDSISLYNKSYNSTEDQQEEPNLRRHSISNEDISRTEHNIRKHSYQSLANEYHGESNAINNNTNTNNYYNNEYHYQDDKNSYRMMSSRNSIYSFSSVTESSINMNDVMKMYNNTNNDDNRSFKSISIMNQSMTMDDNRSYKSENYQHNSFQSNASNPNNEIQSSPVASPLLSSSCSVVPPRRPLRYFEKTNPSSKSISETSSEYMQSKNSTPINPPHVPPRRHYPSSENIMNNKYKYHDNQPYYGSSGQLPAPPRTSKSRVNLILNNSNNLKYDGFSNSSQVHTERHKSYDQESIKSNNSIDNHEGNEDTLENEKSGSTYGNSRWKEDIFEDDYVYHSGDTREKFPLIYHSANMSEIASNFRKTIKLVKHIKDSIEYSESFSGYDAVTAIAEILGTEDRKLAQQTGQALEEQGMFHDVVYLHKLLDSHNHYYQFQDSAKPIAILEKEEEEEEEENSENEDEDKKLKIKKSESTKSEMESNIFNSDPSGVLVNMSQCYSPTCTEGSPCYSRTCPRRKLMETVSKKETQGRYANMTLTIGLQTTWSTSLGKSLIGKLKRSTIKRQEIIYEFIRTEKEYINDLQSVSKYMIYPLRNGKVPGINSALVDSIFINIEEILSVNQMFYENLRKIQKRKPVLESMGDVVKDAVVNFNCYIKYGEKQPRAKQILQLQKNKNRHLATFLKDCQSMPQFRRLPIESFLARPTTRLGRYPILIRDILKNTSKNHRDQILLKEANESIEKVLKQVNASAGKETNRLKMEQWSELLKQEKKSDTSVLHLNDPRREYIREGKLSLIMNVYMNEPLLEVVLLLLDNMIIITYQKANSYHIYGRPIPISLLKLAFSEEKKPLKPHPEVHSNNKKLGINNIKTQTEAQTGYVFSIKHLSVGTYSFYTPVLSEQKAWIEAIQKQQGLLPPPIVKEIVFFSHKFTDSPIITVHRLNSGELLLATDAGLYILVNNSIMKLLISLTKITQIESMEKFDILFILSNRETYSFSISMLLNGVYLNSSYIKQSKKISSNVTFIATGVCDERHLLCCVKASTNNTVVKMFEPKYELADVNRRKMSQKLYVKGDVLKAFKQFYIPSEGISIRFLRRSLCVGCTKGFEVVSIQNLTTQSLLNPQDEGFRFLFKSDNIPINMFKTPENDFLLCYNKLGFFIDKNGNRSRPKILFRWFGNPKSFAYKSPNIYVITSEYISIWDENSTYEHKQVISGSQMVLQYHDENNIIFSHTERGGPQRMATIDNL